MKRVHFMGIGGVGMAGLAFLLKKAGHLVTGCDKYASARTRWLEANGIPVAVGHSPDHLADADELIVTPAVPPSAPELAEATRLAGAQSVRTFEVRYRGAVLAELVNAAQGIAVCGTHGKTTTSTFTTKLLRALGDNPSWCIGGETGAMPVAGSGGDTLVVEADESDGTLALYHPQVLVLNAVDFDHLEHFASPEAYFDCYRTAIRNTQRTVIVCADHPRALALAREALPAGVRLVTFGFAADADVSATAWPDLPNLVLGRHNVLNALAAIAVALSRDFAAPAIQSALPAALAELPDRRFQTIAKQDGITVLTDYAHHPAELKCAVEMARQLNPKRLRVLFQPHRYSRTRALRDEFPPAFAAADEVVLIPVYAAFEQPLPGGDIADLFKAFRDFFTQKFPSRPPTALKLARSADEAWQHAFLSAEPGDLILLAGAGDIINLLPRVQADMTPSALAARPRTSVPLAPLSFFRTGGAAVPGPDRIIVGMGSNTWFSDCTVSAEVVKPGLPTGASLLPTHPELAFMAGIPGTLGGWVKMNAGAFGHSISEFIRRVKVDGAWLDRAACGFAYRHSDIHGIIEDVEFESNPGGPRSVAAELPAAYLARRKTFPPRTCGSVFKNPTPENPAGRLLEAAGAKDLRVGGARVWQEHANVIVAEDGCTSSDILALARLMAAAVREKFHVNLQPEIRGLVV